MKIEALVEKNPLTGNYLIHIPGTAHAWYNNSKRAAEKFANNLNNALKSGELYYNEVTGEVLKA